MKNQYEFKDRYSKNYAFNTKHYDSPDLKYKWTVQAMSLFQACAKTDDCMGSELGEVYQWWNSLSKLQTGEIGPNGPGFGILPPRLAAKAAPFLKGKTGGGTGEKGVLPSPCGHSFVPGSEVQLADGSTKPIQNVQPGDEVLATDPETGETNPRTVLAAITTEDDKDFVDLTIKAGDGEASIVSTPNHPFWVPELKQWINGGDLKPGEWLLTSTGTWVQVGAIHHFREQQRTHDLTVDGFHTYYVLAGETPVRVHNNTCPVYENPGHHDPTGGPNSHIPKKAVLPGDAEEQFGKSVLVDGTRWTKVGSGKNAEYYRYFDDGNGMWHWSGSTRGVTKSGTAVPIPMSRVPIEVKRG